MPCYTNRTIGVELKDVGDQARLVRALQAAGLHSHTSASLETVAAQVIATGRISLTGSSMTRERAEELTGKVKVAYATETVREIGRRFGFTVNQNQQQPTKFNLNRRAF
jgi:hypothetical protein